MIDVFFSGCESKTILDIIGYHIQLAVLVVVRLSYRKTISRTALMIELHLSTTLLRLPKIDLNTIAVHHTAGLLYCFYLDMTIIV